MRENGKKKRKENVKTKHRGDAGEKRRLREERTPLRT